jgi:Chemoreceptor zinc-binding domain
MDFNGAIRAHTEWKLRLLNYSWGNLNDTIDLASLRKDDLCALGKWIHGEGEQYQGDADWQEMARAHASFHLRAAEVAAMVECGQGAAAEALLSSRESEYGKLTLQVTDLLMRLKTKYSKE